MSNLPTEDPGAEKNAADQQPTADQAKTPAPPASSARPRPAFGEYAPEGWEWKPEGADQPASPNAPSTPAARPASGAIAGVPHNLGAANGGSGSGATATSAPRPERSAGSQTPGDPVPYRATEAPSAPPAAFAMTSVAPTKSRTGDRVVTIVLLALGALGALNVAYSLMALPSILIMYSDAFEIEDFEVPAWVNTLGLVSALAILALYAVVLIFSIRRMRARKVTFWVPLSAGVVAFIAATTISMIAVAAVPELLSAMSAPDAIQKMIDYSLSTTP